MKKNNEKFMQYFIMFFVVIQPLLDIIFLYDDNVIEVFIFSPSTIFRYLGTGLLLLIYLVIYRVKKIPKCIILYCFFLILYIIGHHLNALNFVSVSPDNFGYSLFSEIFYISRFILPIIIMYVIFNIEFCKKNVENVIIFLICIISGSILITNIIGTTLLSYTNNVADINIFEWFLPQYANLNHELTATKFYFIYANCIATILVLLTPIMYYFFSVNSSKKNILLIYINALSLLILGTRVSSYGIVIITAISIIIYLFFVFIKKQIKYNKKVLFHYIGVTLLILTIYPYAPLSRRNIVVDYSANDPEIDDLFNGEEDDDEEEEEEDIEDQVGFNKLTEEELKLLYVETNNYLVDLDDADNQKYLNVFLVNYYYNYGISYTLMFDSYNYEFDPYFWFDIFGESYENRIDNRFIQNKILLRVKEYNNNEMDLLFGITYTRMGNIFNLERDFLSHYHTLGILGLIVLLPYWVISILGIYIVINHRLYFNFFNVMLCFGICFSMFAAFYSGNSIDNLSYSLILSFVFAVLLKNIFDTTNK